MLKNDSKKYNRGKKPGEYPELWKPEPALSEKTARIAWDDLPDGIVAVGVECTYTDTAWRCIDQHIKSTVNKPKAGSKKWEEITW